uniref:Uncharacterized protein n=1 Tax=Oryza barthii TaxID=65489 RepID=A0A0D3GB33_9ORYZ
MQREKQKRRARKKRGREVEKEKKSKQRQGTASSPAESNTKTSRDPAAGGVLLPLPPPQPTALIPSAISVHLRLKKLSDVGGVRRDGERRRRRRRRRSREGAGPVPADRQHRPHHAPGRAGERQDRQGLQGVRPGVRLRVHQLHHQRSKRQVPQGEAQDHQWGRPDLVNGHARIRGLCRASQALPQALPGG